jgi:RNA-directed DNA polymerase
MSKILFSHEYKDIISIENLLEAWKEFVRGKKSRKDVQEFGRNLMGNIISLHSDLLHKTYKHGEYVAFNISDPKPRNIHKALVRDRLLHHALYRNLYPFFERTFIADSYSCRVGKGTHRALERFKDFSLRATQNNFRTGWVLKCDIRKFFASIDQKILENIIEPYIPDNDIRELLSRIISSFNSSKPDVGLPLGNLTSQLLVNIYMNTFDQWMKHKIKAKYYIRYADDFVIFSEDKDWLLELTPKIADFLHNNLKLSLHPNKVYIKTVSSGVDFLGWVHFPDHRVFRTTTKRRMFKNIEIKEGKKETVQSYLGLLKHGNTHKLVKQLDVLEYPYEQLQRRHRHN